MKLKKALHISINYIRFGLGYEKIKLVDFESLGVSYFSLALKSMNIIGFYIFLYISFKAIQYILYLLTEYEGVINLLRGIAFVLLFLDEIGSSKLDFAKINVFILFMIRVLAKFSLFFFLDNVMVKLFADWF